MAETGLNQNWNRDYDPLVGKYVESDPIGLYGGSYSTYAYVNASPLGNIDPSGLAPPRGTTAPSVLPPGPFEFIWLGSPQNTAWVQNAASQIGDAVDSLEQAMHQAATAVYNYCTKNDESCQMTTSNVERRRVMDAQGRLVEEADYVGDVLHGKRLLWSPSGVKIGEADYENGKLHGRSRLWSEAGQLTLDAHYVQGELHGPYSTWWDDGSPKEQGRFEHGSRVGTYRWFAPGGSLQSEHSYPESRP